MDTAEGPARPGAAPEQPHLGRVAGEGAELACWEWAAQAPGSGATDLLFVHATGFHGRVWDPVIRRLPAAARRGRVLALEQRGHGRSQAVPFDGWPVFGRDLAAAAKGLGLQGAVGIGHSMGAHALVQAAAFAPGAFSRLVLIDPVIQAPERYHLPPLPAHLLPQAAQRKNRFESAEAMAARFADRLPYSRMTTEGLRAYCDHALKPAEDGQGFELLCAPAFEAQVYGLGRFNAGVYASIRALHIPVLVLRAMEPEPGATGFNPLVSPTWPQLAGEFRHGTDRYLPEHAHLMPMEDPGLMAQIVAELL